MRWGRRAKTLILTFVPAALLITTQVHAKTEAEVKIWKSGQSEQYERDVDQVALASQEKAISKLTTLLNKYKNTRQESMLLLKLAELQTQNASILSRIAHGSAHNSKKAIDLTRFKKAMGQAISTLNTLIAKYPNFEEVNKAYFMRGKAHEEVENKPLATKDYLKLVKDFPESEEVPSAYMSLAEFAIEANLHEKAITYLEEVEKRPEDPRFPFALYKLAWSHYNLKHIPTALSYAERQVSYYNHRPKTSDAENIVSDSDVAFKENMLMDTAIFFLEGYEEKLPQYTLSDALPYFKKLDTTPVLGRILTRFGKLLRSHGHEADLILFKDQVLASESNRPEALEIVIITYEFQLNKRRYQQLTDTAQDIVRLYGKNKKNEAFTRAQKLLLDTAEGMQAMIVKNKDATEVTSYSSTLASIYDAFTRVVDDSDPRIPRVHYNLAETLFTIRDYMGATDHYRWVVDHGSWKQKGQTVATSVDASLKAIASRYEVLKQRQLLPKEITPIALSKKSDKTMDPLLSQWIAWIDTHVKYEKKDTENFVFEANRALYANGHLTDAIDRLKTFAVKYPKSQYSISSASLVIDTYIASSDWEKSNEIATEFMEVDAWKKTDFSKKLFSIAADSSFKLLEIKHKNKDYKGTLKAAEDFLDQYRTSERFADCLSLAGNAAMEIADKKRAVGYFTRLIKEAPKTDNVGPAILARASIEEEKYQFSSAATDYKLYISLPTAQQKLDTSKLDALRKKTLMLSWLSGNYGELKANLDSKSICTEALTDDCEKFGILVLINSADKSKDPKTTEEAFDRARKSNGAVKALWASLALEGAKSLAWRDRNIAVKALVTGWEDLDPLMKFSLVSNISLSIPKAFQMNRSMMREIAPLRADEKYITHRVDVIREMESTATKAMKLPWSRIRAEVLNEISALYLDLSRGLTTIAPPKNLNPAEIAAYEETIRRLVMPFEEKGQEMRAKAFEIASRFAIEDSSFGAIAEPFFAENPSQAKSLRPVIKLQKPADLSVSLMETIDPSGRWDAIRKGKTIDPEEAPLYIKSLWSAALKARNWPQVAYFLQQAHEKSAIPEGKIGVAKAISLATVGARGEGLAELESSRKSLDISGRNASLMVLVQYSMQACDRNKTQSYLKDIQADQLSSDQASLVANATAYVSSRAPASTK